MPERVPKLMQTLGCILQKIKEDDVVRVAETSFLNKPVHAISLDAAPEKKQEDLEQLSAKYRNEGNQFFKQGNHLYACNLYTRSIASALQGPVCALAYANRSAALFYMCKFEECLEDIERAINNGYEEKLLHKLYLRKARCLKLLGRDFRESFDKGFKMYEKYNQDDLPKLKETLENELEQPVFENVKTGQYYSDGNVPPLNYGINDEVPCFSSAVSVAYSKELGRHLIANRDIQIGDVLIVEKPIAAVVDLDNTNKACCRCFKISCSLIPCSHCQQFMYCGKECLDLDWKEGHKDECSMLSEFLGLAVNLADEQVLMGYNKQTYTLPHLAFALMVRTIGLSKMKEAVIANDPMSESYLDPRTRGFKDGKFTYSLEALLSLTCNFDKLTTGEGDLLMAHAIVNVMQVPDWDDKKEAMTALFIKLYLICLFNYKPISVFSSFELKDIDENWAQGQRGPFSTQMEYGFGLYLASSMINHSCDSNMIKVNYGKTVVYRATKPIKIGDQLTETFYMDRLLFDLEERQEMLKKFCKFECACDACKNNWPDWEGLRRVDTNMSSSEFLFVLRSLKELDPEEVIAASYFAECEFPVNVELMPKLLMCVNKLYNLPECGQIIYFQKYRKSLINHFLTLGGAILSKTGLSFFTCKQKERFPVLFAPNFEQDFVYMIMNETVTFCSP